MTITGKERETELLHEAEQLAEIYENGKGTGIDYAKALQWRKQAVDLSEQIYGKEQPAPLKHTTT
jgi:TPR repeat protein